MVTQLLPYLDSLFMTLHFLYHLLNHTESILIHGQFYQLIKHWVEYEINILLLQAQEHFLQYMSSIWIECQWNNILSYSILQLFLLCTHIDHFNQALH